MTDLKKSAEKEISRMQQVFDKLEVHVHHPASLQFYDFAERYFNDGKWFFEKERFLEAFEAAVIAWA
ncbi:MAG: hypothetical protein V1839_02480, partial [archaeon]